MKKEELLKATNKIKRERPYYFVCVNGSILFESELISECKAYLKEAIKENEDKILEDENFYDYYIGMYSITLDMFL